MDLYGNGLNGSDVLTGGGGPSAGTFTGHTQCPSNLVSKLIGSSGITIKAIQAQSNARIQIDQKAEGELKPVIVTGASQEVVDTAIQLIRDTLDAPSNPQGEASRTVECPPGIVGRIIGRGGETIRAFQTASGAHIQVDQNYPEGVNRKVIVSGKVDAVDRAVLMITELINGEPNSAQSIVQKYGRGQGALSRVLQCPKNLVGRVIGKGGETIKNLQRQSGNSSIQIDQTVDPPKITVIGSTPEQVERAVQLISQLLEQPVEPYFGGQGGAAGGAFSGQRAAGAYGTPAAGYGGYGAGAAGNFSAAGGAYGGGYGNPAAAAPGYGGYGNFSSGGPGGYPATGYAAGYGGSSAGGAFGGAAAYPGYGQSSDPYAQGGGYGTGAGFGGAAQVGGAAAGQQAAPQGAASVWQELQDNEGRSYFYNTQTGVSQWEKPADMQ